MRHLMTALAGVCMLFNTAVFAAVKVDAPRLVLPAESGELDLQSLRGKVVYLDFWASWCRPCQKSFPWMKQIQQSYRDQGLEVVAINLDKDRQLAKDFLSKMDVNFIVAYDESGDSASQYRLRGMPGSYLIDRDGKLVAAHIGFRDKDKAGIENAIRNLLKQGTVQ